MALRSQIGSALLAKSSPGSASRDLTENQIQKPALPGKGDIGTISRDLTAEPEVIAAAPGSEKIIAAGPGVEGSEIVSPTTPPQLLADGGIGLPPNMQPNGPMRSGNVAQNGFTDGVAPSSAPAAGGRTATSRSGGGQAGPVEATGSILPMGESSNVQAPRSASAPANNPLLGNLLGTRVSADPGVIGPSAAPPEVERGLFGGQSAVDPQSGQVLSADRTTGQVLAGAAGKVLSKIPATANIGNKLQTYGGSSTAAAQGSGSVSNVLRSIANSVSSGASKAKNTITSLLRSLFK